MSTHFFITGSMIMAKVQDCGLKISQVEKSVSTIMFAFRLIPRKKYEPLYPPNDGLNSIKLHIKLPWKRAS